MSSRETANTTSGRGRDVDTRRPEMGVEDDTEVTTFYTHDRGVPQCGAEKHPLNLTQIMLA